MGPRLSFLHLGVLIVTNQIDILESHSLWSSLNQLETSKLGGDLRLGSSDVAWPTRRVHFSAINAWHL